MITAPLEASATRTAEKVVNDFSISIATVNGSGSQTANTAILRALFKMGIPVNGKNLFPSNIKGMPTWYIIRLSKAGYAARRDTVEIVVAMNQQSVEEDLQQVAPGGVFFFDEALRFERSRDDVTYYPMPVKALVKDTAVPTALKNYIVNMVYVGVVSAVLGIDIAEVENALHHHFKGKAKPVALNMEVVNRAYLWARENVLKADPFYVEPMDATEGMIMLDGNAAAALGAVYGGVTLAAWYPITPSTSVIDNLNHYLARLRTDPETGKATYAVVQAEDELAAIGTVLGAGWAGARAMTATSGPGISLMAEFAGMGYFAEIPAVIWDVMRMGPSTGLPTRTSQGDVIFIYTLGHGDTKQVCLFPADPKECFDFGVIAFDLAEQLQTPVFVLSDLDLGMNQWMSPVFEYPAQPINRGKVLDAEALEKAGQFARYRDVDGDGIPYRTIPGTDHPLAAYFTRGTGHDENAIYSERPDVWERNLQRLARKFETARTLVPAPEVDAAANAEAGIIAYGTTHPAIVEARDRLAAAGLTTDYLRLRALPFHPDVEAFIAAHERVYVVENNFNGQMCQILRMELPELAPKLISIAHCDGLPLTAGWVTSSILEKEQ
ncbi:MAG: 2-oxoacid:acceptor oxidoreductase subunit alpha [Caldilineae bacterium]|nr:MAG: 2-oxoacid:acceptor oxidoreductase subunit alpha [Caldilineae bacterium]